MTLDQEWEDEVIRIALIKGPFRVDLGKVQQGDVDRERERLQKAALRQTEPIEIITGSDPHGNIHLTVRRYL
jgi:hypothetical protein